MTLADAGRSVKRHNQWIKGAAQVLGVKLFWVGNALAMNSKDFERLRKAALEVQEPERQPLEAAAS